ncbi:hypothetical protein ABZ871_22685 [Streptomyces populi]
MDDCLTWNEPAPGGRSAAPPPASATATGTFDSSRRGIPGMRITPGIRPGHPRGGRTAQKKNVELDGA